MTPLEYFQSRSPNARPGVIERNLRAYKVHFSANPRSWYASGICPTIGPVMADDWQYVTCKRCLKARP